MGNKMEAASNWLWNRRAFTLSRIVYRLGGNGAKRANERRRDAMGLPF